PAVGDGVYAKHKVKLSAREEPFDLRVLQQEVDATDRRKREQSANAPRARRGLDNGLVEVLRIVSGGVLEMERKAHGASRLRRAARERGGARGASTTPWVRAAPIADHSVDTPSAPDTAAPLDHGRRVRVASQRSRCVHEPS